MRKLLALLLTITAIASLSAQSLTLQKGDNLVFIGGGLADRQQSPATK
ncbi:MAG: hypothetical protein NTX20_07875 [Verrucomicrobia bacterium]|nr:hypothetical protein [Verrucomicrobiota bacterium]